MLGLSNTWDGGSLPFPLQAIYGASAPDCRLLVRPDTNVLLANAGGTAGAAVTVGAK